jgi:RNA recognition motif-containing protein
MAETTLIVGNLSSRTSEDEIRQVFAAHGTVYAVDLAADPESGRSRGSAFVEMGRVSEAQAAVDQLNGQILGGNTIKVSIAKARAARSGRGEFTGGDRTRY